MKRPRLIYGLLLLGVGLWALSAPRGLEQVPMPSHYQPDVARGKLLYTIAGCHSCHKPGDARADADLPSGGAELKTPIGRLYPPNITPDATTGIGGWSDVQFLSAVTRGVSPQGRHLIPALPYTSYAQMSPADVLDIKAYLMTLPAIVSPAKAADIPLQPLLRRGVGLWKWFGLSTKPWMPDPSQSAQWNRGSYLVNAPGHCGQCHSPRNIFMIPEEDRFLSGGPHPDGEGQVPSLRGLIERGRYKTVADLVSALQNGEVLGYGRLSAGGMGAVQDNISQLPESDVEAIAAYLVSLK